MSLKLIRGYVPTDPNLPIAATNIAYVGLILSREARPLRIAISNTFPHANMVIQPLDTHLPSGSNWKTFPCTLTAARPEAPSPHPSTHPYTYSFALLWWHPPGFVEILENHEPVDLARFRAVEMDEGDSFAFSVPTPPSELVVGGIGQPRPDLGSGPLRKTPTKAALSKVARRTVTLLGRPACARRRINSIQEKQSATFDFGNMTTSTDDPSMSVKASKKPVTTSSDEPSSPVEVSKTSTKAALSKAARRNLPLRGRPAPSADPAPRAHRRTNPDQGRRAAAFDFCDMTASLDKPSLSVEVSEGPSATVAGSSDARKGGNAVVDGKGKFIDEADSGDLADDEVSEESMAHEGDVDMDAVRLRERNAKYAKLPPFAMKSPPHGSSSPIEASAASPPSTKAGASGDEDSVMDENI